MNNAAEEPAASHKGCAMFIRFNPHHTGILQAAADLCGIDKTDMLRRMVDHWDATHGSKKLSAAGALSQGG